MTQKLYPFSMEKNGHNIELAFNRSYILMCDAETDGDYDRADEYASAHEKISTVYDELLGYRPNYNGVIMIPGKLLAQAKEISLLAEQIRDGLNMQYQE